MKLKIFRVRTSLFHPPITKFVLGVEKDQVAKRENCRIEEITELENEVVVIVNVSALGGVDKKP